MFINWEYLQIVVLLLIAVSNIVGVLYLFVIAQILQEREIRERHYQGKK